MDQQHVENIWKIMREHNLELVDNMSSEFKCIICKKILINACMAPCGCRFCVECIKEYLRIERKICPGQSRLCEDELIDFDTDIQISQRLNKRIPKLSVKCPNIGCQSQVELNMIENHLRICENQPESCPYLILGCEVDKLGNDQVRDHISMEIHSHTKLLINWIRDSANETKSIRSDMDKLKSGNDELKEEIRSNEEGTKNIIQDLQKRERENSSEIEILNEEMCFLKNCNRSMKEEMEILKDKQREQVSQLETTIKYQSREIDQLKTAAQIQNEEIEKLKEGHQQAETRFEDIRVNMEQWKGQELQQLKTAAQIQSEEIEQLKQRCQQTESRLEEIRQREEECKDVPMKLDEISQASAALREESMETRKSMEIIREDIDQINYEEIEWKIDNWPEEVRKAGNDGNREIFSQNFFTHKNGFKICLSVCPGWNHYLGISFYILRGPFDDSLRWPFDRDLECSLIDQKSGRAYQSISRKSSDYPNRAGLQKPSSEKNERAFYFPFNISPNQMSSRPELCQILFKLTAKPAKHRK